MGKLAHSTVAEPMTQTPPQPGRGEEALPPGMAPPNSLDERQLAGRHLPNSGDHFPNSGDHFPNSGDHFPNSGDRLPNPGEPALRGAEDHPKAGDRQGRKDS